MKVELKLPVLALVDSDPFGVPSDLDKIPDDCRLPMTEKDIKYVKTLLKGDFVKNNPGRVKELNLMMESKYKAEWRRWAHWGFSTLPWCMCH
ncbi:DNA topoisomerase 6 subunit A [Orobanche minor]